LTSGPILTGNSRISILQVAAEVALDASAIGHGDFGGWLGNA